MTRRSQPLFEEETENKPTPLEDILQPATAFMSEPLDLPDDRFVSLEDMLYAAGSAFARPSPELEEYYVTARKREAEALAQPEMPDSVTKPDEVTATLATSTQTTTMKSIHKQGRHYPRSWR